MLGVKLLVRIQALVEERPDAPESLPECVLGYIKGGGLATNVRDFVGLQRCHLLFDCDGDLLRVVPLLR